MQNLSKANFVIKNSMSFAKWHWPVSYKKKKKKKKENPPKRLSFCLVKLNIDEL